MSKPWGNIGAWAADSEAAEAEEREAAAKEASAGSDNFPSLKEAVTAKPKKNKKMSLSEFARGGYSSGGGATDYPRLTPDEMLRLPTGPKERSAEEMQFNRLGGGFSNFDRGGRGRDRDGGSGDANWGAGRRSYGGFDDERRAPNSRVSDFDQPSRADEVDNWASVKKTLPSFDSGRQNRYGGGGGGGGGGGFGGESKADGVDNWAVGKKPLPVRSSGYGYRDSGTEPDRWSRGSAVEPDRWARGAPRETEQQRPRLVLDPRKSDGSVNEAPVVKTNKPNPFGAARPREEVLAEKGFDWKKLDSEIEAKNRPTSSHSSRPSSAQSNRSEGPDGAVKPRPKVNPFGDAKPREVLLSERGKDWRKIDLELEHRAVDRPETVEEKLLKEEIDNLKKELEKESTINSNKESADDAGVDQTGMRAMLQEKERELELLIRDLDDKVRFGQKAVERPGSSAGKTAGFSDRPPSRSGSFEDSRSVDFTDRPRSRGTGDMSMRPTDDRRQFQGSRERGWFSNNRDLNRSGPKERW
ncbi:eukaryotic translation initiation factor 4B2 [Trifolium repens]|nr:eukaryotic translation initiation factor 4B2 [Trifolium repens]